MDKTNVGNLLMEKGLKFYKWGRSGIYDLIVGIALAACICIVSLAGYGRVYFFDGYESTAVLWGCSFFLICIGTALTPLYFIGLHFMGLGRMNQFNDAIYKHLLNQRPKANDELPEL